MKTQDLHPLPSQVPFLLDVYAENVNIVVQVVHLPTVSKMIRDMRSRSTSDIVPANEALLFSIYYAAIASMEEDDVGPLLLESSFRVLRGNTDHLHQVMTNFGVPMTELSLRYRRGFENALAKSDFLHAPDPVLVQALAIFLFLVRRHESPRYVCMMTG